MQRMPPNSGGNCPDYANALSTLSFRVYVAIVYCWAYSMQSDNSYRQYFSSTHGTDDLWKLVLADSYHVDRPVPCAVLGGT